MYFVDRAKDKATNSTANKVPDTNSYILNTNKRRKKKKNGKNNAKTVQLEIEATRKETVAVVESARRQTKKERAKEESRESTELKDKAESQAALTAVIERVPDLAFADEIAFSPGQTFVESGEPLEDDDILFKDEGIGEDFMEDEDTYEEEEDDEIEDPRISNERDYGYIWELLNEKRLAACLSTHLDDEEQVQEAILDRVNVWKQFNKEFTIWRQQKEQPLVSPSLLTEPSTPEAEQMADDLDLDVSVSPCRILAGDGEMSPDSPVLHVQKPQQPQPDAHSRNNLYRPFPANHHQATAAAARSHNNSNTNGGSSRNTWYSNQHLNRVCPVPGSGDAAGSGRKPPGQNAQQQQYRKKMMFTQKIGVFGWLPGQFTEPSGIAVTLDGNLAIVDTNNHRVQLFNANCEFLFQFGEGGKRQGQMLYPNRIAVSPLTGDFVITERAPTHQVQIFTPGGQFVRKFGHHVLHHPRGVAVDDNNQIIVVECKLMKVTIFSFDGRVLSSFAAPEHLIFPNSIAIGAPGELLICDNLGHAVKVFDYEGTFLRKIGADNVTNFPVGVTFDPTSGHVLVVDNHNNFNLTIFNSEGKMVDAFESKVRHAQCLDIALLNGCIYVTSKDFKVFCYPFKFLSLGY